jgi:hypothetical protein
MRYFVYNHHDFWKWSTSEDGLMESDIVFIWSDWPFRNEVNTLKSLGKKIIVYEHGFGSMFDYELNDREPIADGYLVLGQESKGSLMRVGVDPKKILITGNPIYDDVKKTNHTGKEALFVALHWVRDMSYYNQTVFEQLKTAYPQFNWTVKLTDKTGNLIATKGWYNNVEDNILQDIKDNLPDYDMVFTPRPSTFESFARLMGIPVYVVDKEQSYAEEGEPELMPFNSTYLKIGDKLPEQKPVDMDKYIRRPSLSLDLILDWIKAL